MAFVPVFVVFIGPLASLAVRMAPQPSAAATALRRRRDRNDNATARTPPPPPSARSLSTRPPCRPSLAKFVLASHHTADRPMDGDRRASASPSAGAPPPAVLKSQSQVDDGGVLPTDASSSLLPPPMSAVTSSASVDSGPPPPAATALQRIHSSAHVAAADPPGRQESGDTGHSADSAILVDDAVRSHHPDGGRAQMVSPSHLQTASASASAGGSASLLASQLATSLPPLEPTHTHSAQAMDTNNNDTADSAPSGSANDTAGEAAPVDDRRSGWFALCEILLKKGPKYAGKCLAERTERSVRDGQRE